MALYQSVADTIGNTPLVRIKNFEKANDLEANVYAKLEYFNPAGSVKDRIAKAIIDDAVATGKLKEGATIIEPTSGNTGIGISSYAAAKGFKVIITMPESMSVERRNLMKAYGAELVLTDASQGMKGAIAKAKELHEQTPNSIIAGQFENPVNPKAHYETTGPEIYRDLDGKVDIFIAGVGAISLLVGGIGVMNIMLVSVTERTREIGIRKSLGAKTRVITMQFLTESVILCLIGGIIGVTLGLAGAYGACAIIDIQPKISVWLILLALLFSSGVGLVFGVYPARKAAQLSPIEALRAD